MNVVLGFVILAVLVWLYFLPAFVAKARRHQNTMAIFVLDLLAGWTFVGWLIAIVWACSHVDRQMPTAYRPDGPRTF